MWFFGCPCPMGLIELFDINHEGHCFHSSPISFLCKADIKDFQASIDTELCETGNWRAGSHGQFTKPTNTYCHLGYVGKTTSQCISGDQCIVPCIPYTDCDLNTSWPGYRRSTLRLAAKPSERVVPERAVLLGIQSVLDTLR